ncbi:MAG: flagellar biosynthesis anti-sigma factor FlgM [Phycisphaerae bacterium]|nr:flagellar biosynthesis anti-sigma factor FlgM [Phycisphaerae bacterium]
MGDIIGVDGFLQPLPADYAARHEGRGRGNCNDATVAGSAVGGGEVHDQVELSDLGRRLAHLADAPNLRLERIRRIQDAIAAGTYETPAKIAVVVDRLLEQLKE